jgi:hypothetical protein
MAFKRTNAGRFPVRYNVHIQMNIFVPRLFLSVSETHIVSLAFSSVVLMFQILSLSSGFDVISVVFPDDGDRDSL